MKQFNFRLERLLRIKEHDEMKAKQHYGVMLQKYVELDNSNREMEQAIADSYSSEYDSESKTHTIDFNSIHLSEYYVRGLKEQISQNIEEKAGMEEELAKRKKALEEAMKEKKSLEKLKERAYKRFKEEYHKEQAKKIDELAVLGKYFSQEF